ncbi:MAG: zinc-dependent peptidase [Cellvibrionaceae bacterium]
MLSWIKGVWEIFYKPELQESGLWKSEWSQFLEDKVQFYRKLSFKDKLIFQKRALLFLQTTDIESGQFSVTDEDRLLVAASAIIPVWGFPKWHYLNLKGVYLLPAAFNENFECQQPDSMITGMVGSGPMAGKMALSKPDLYAGFENIRDKRNVGIHEFAHLVDMADGDTDGFPERLKEYAFAIPWFSFIEGKIQDIDKGKSNIRAYGGTSKVEFFAVASEYFFERPKMLKKKHPKLFQRLSDFYKQDVLSIEDDIRQRKKGPCPCGSGKRYKRCCLPE